MLQAKAISLMFHVEFCIGRDGDSLSAVVSSWLSLCWLLRSSHVSGWCLLVWSDSCGLAPLRSAISPVVCPSHGWFYPPSSFPCRSPVLWSLSFPSSRLCSACLVDLFAVCAADLLLHLLIAALSPFIWAVICPRRSRSPARVLRVEVELSSPPGKTRTFNLCSNPPLLITAPLWPFVYVLYLNLVGGFCRVEQNYNIFLSSHSYNTYPAF